MSTHFYLWCGTCEDHGSHFRCSPSGSGCQSRDDSDQTWEGGAADWHNWLLDHEHHEIELHTECDHCTRPKAEEQRKKAEALGMTPAEYFVNRHL
jgi:hypothetical protein